jgi:hypothetical protein
MNALPITTANRVKQARLKTVPFVVWSYGINRTRDSTEAHAERIDTRQRRLESRPTTRTYCVREMKHRGQMSVKAV